MIVCVCHSITDHQIRHAAQQGVSSMNQLKQQLPVATNCGKCGDCARRIINEETAANFWQSAASVA